MPYSKKSKFKHMRQKPPSKFRPGTFRNVPISHTPQGKRKKYPTGTRAIVGKLKKAVKGKRGMKHYATQSILIPKRR